MSQILKNSLKKSRSILERIARGLGIDLLGIADISQGKENIFQLPEHLVKKMSMAIVIGARLSPAIIDSLEGSPNLVYYHHYRQLNAFLDQAALKIAQEIIKQGYLALPIAASQLVDWERQLAHVSHKELARLAGLGWRGRNNLLVTEAWGSQIRLVSILTDFPLKPALPLLKDCGSCMACLPVCPVGAIKEDVKDFDSMACYQQLREFSKKYHLGHNICGLCVQACPGTGGNGKSRATCSC